MLNLFLGPYIKDKNYIDWTESSRRPIQKQEIIPAHYRRFDSKWELSASSFCRFYIPLPRTVDYP